MTQQQKRGQVGGQRDGSMRSRVKSTIHARSCSISNDEGYELPGEDVWEDNDAFVSDRFIQNVSLNASKYFVISQATLLISYPKIHFLSFKVQSAGFMVIYCH